MPTIELTEPTTPTITRQQTEPDRSRFMRMATSSWGLSVAALLILTPIYIYYSYLLAGATNSDSALNALIAYDMTQGRPLLQGWTQGTNSWLTNELLLYAIVTAIVGLKPAVIYLSHGIIYSVIIVLAAWLAAGVTKNRRRALVAAALAAAMLLPVNPDGSVGWMFLSIIDHLGTSIPLMILLLILDRIRPGRRAGVAAFGILTWAMTSDHLALYVGVAPIVAVAAVRACLTKDNRKGYLALIIGALAAVPAEIAFKAALKLISGTSSNPPDIIFAAAGDLAANFWETIDGLMILFGAPLFGRVAADAKTDIVHLAVLATAVAGWILAIRAIKQISLVDQILITAIAVNIVAFFFSTMPGPDYTSHEMLVIVPFSAALAGRMIAPRLATPQSRVPVYAGFVVAVALLGHALVTAPARQDPTYEVRRWLTRNNLTYGLAPFWQAHSTSLLSEGRIRIPAVVNDGHGTVTPFWQMMRDDFYDPARHDARFVISLTQDWFLPAHDLNGPLLERNFGPPKETVRIGNFEIRVYDYNILTRLPREKLPHQL